MKNWKHCKFNAFEIINEMLLYIAKPNSEFISSRFTQLLLQKLFVGGIISLYCADFCVIFKFFYWSVSVDEQCENKIEIYSCNFRLYWLGVQTPCSVFCVKCRYAFWPLVEHHSLIGLLICTSRLREDLLDRILLSERAWSWIGVWRCMPFIGCLIYLKYSIMFEQSSLLYKIPPKLAANEVASVWHF